jgi:hypothetical protein
MVDWDSSFTDFVIVIWLQRWFSFRFPQPDTNIYQHAFTGSNYDTITNRDPNASTDGYTYIYNDPDSNPDSHPNHNGYANDHTHTDL